MPEPPEVAADQVSTDELLRRLDIFRERYQAGLMTAAEINAILPLFQFTDDDGHIWAPGVQTNTWYRWDGTEWTAADPPETLTVPVMPIEVTSVLEVEAATPERRRRRKTSRAASPRREPQDAICPNCGAAGQTARFCTRCGTALR